MKSTRKATKGYKSATEVLTQRGGNIKTPPPHAVQEGATALQDQIDEVVKSAVDKIVLVIVVQILSLILPTVTEDAASGQHQHSEATSQWPTDGVHHNMWDTRVPPVPPSGYEHQQARQLTSLDGHGLRPY